ncbi:MAG: hypothetical protein J6V41_07975 [Kiritimatiellae bacterium]|nr:hypothetical protein [Kiritimatiellia bacterium]
MNLKNYFLMSLPILSASLIAGDIYVDSSFDGTSTGAKDAPYTTIQAAANAAQQGDTIWLYGSDTVSYVMEDDSAAVVIDPDNVTIRGYTDEGEAANWSETNKMAKVFIKNGYAKNSKAVDGNVQRPITLNGASPKIQGVYFDFGATSFRQQDQGGDNLIMVTNVNFVCENSFFYMSSKLGYNGSNQPISALNIKNAVKHNMIIRNCGFNYHSHYRSDAVPIGQCNGVLRVENCYFEHVSRMSSGGSDEIRDTTLSVVSNVIYNCGSSANGYVDSFFTKGGNYFPNNAEIAYNRFIRDDFDPKSEWGKQQFGFLAHGGHYGGPFRGEVNIHHNTIVGADSAFVTNRRLSGDEGVDLWTPAIHNNLIILNEGGMLIEEKEGSPPGRFFNNKGFTTSYRLGSTIRNNAIMCDTFLGGDATTNSWYKLEYEEGANSGVELIDNINLEEAPTFVNTTDPTHEDFYRLRLSDYAWVRKNAWTGENGEYPRYIGALEPLLSTGFLIVIK